MALNQSSVGETLLCKKCDSRVFPVKSSAESEIILYRCSHCSKGAPADSDVWFSTINPISPKFLPLAEELLYDPYLEFHYYE